MDDSHKDELMQSTFKGKSKIDISRFKGLGEMPAKQLKETTMDPASRTLLRVTLPDAAAIHALSDDSEEAENPLEIASNSNEDLDDLVDRLMGKNAEKRFQFIQDNAEFANDIDI